MTEAWVQGVALVAPVVAGIGGALLTNHYAQRMSRESRLGDKQVDAYIMLAEYAVRIRQQSIVVTPDVLEDHPLMPPPLSEQERYRMFAFVEAFGSNTVRDSYERLLTAFAEFNLAILAFGSFRDMPGPYGEDDRQARTDTLRDVHSSRKQLRTVCEEALGLINAELRSASRSRWRRRRPISDPLSPAASTPEDASREGDAA
jgi:hypothetical protein